MTTATPATLPLFTTAQLPPPPPPPAPPRPKLHDAEVLDAAVDLLWPRMLAWLSQEAPLPESEHADHKADLRKHIGHCDDGYAFARALDDWEPDADLVETLDAVLPYKHRAHDQVVEAWVKAHGITAPLPPGTRVKAKVGGRILEGKLVAPEHGAESYVKRAQYLVFVASEGHVRSGQGSSGFIVSAEDVEAI